MYMYILLTYKLKLHATIKPRIMSLYILLGEKYAGPSSDFGQLSKTALSEIWPWTSNCLNNRIMNANTKAVKHSEI